MPLLYVEQICSFPSQKIQAAIRSTEGLREMQCFNCFALGMLQKLVLHNAYVDISNKDLSMEFETALKRTHMNLTKY